MTQTNAEPTLKDLADKIDHLATEQESLSGKIDKLAGDQTRFDEKFGNYQQAIQWVVQLAFGLIASATVTVIITSVLKR
jgi:peptidoglycan hydrolase CwlO-like protein